ncbi:energy-coupling factor ABC transporter permease [Bermanella sp. R86510]|uniref:energy-coupling factor ABC transporter permease n=1 Tax=unclassified Bermanella TaxID=2627862 RepID=UPI0037CBE86A
MSIEPDLLPTGFMWLALCLAFIPIVLAIYRINWRALQQKPYLQHIFYIVCISLAVLWSIRAGLSSGLGIHFMGLTAATLLMGWPLALLAGALSLLLVSFMGLESFMAFGVNFGISILLPICTSWWILKWVQHALPANPFVYIFLCGFFNGAIAILAVALCTSLMVWGLDIYSASKVYHEYLMYLPLMLFPEAFVNGMVVAGVMGTKPELLSSFDVDKYFSDE